MLHEGMWTPAEIRCPQLLAGKDGSETILKVRGWRQYPGRDVYRALLGYCPFGDLWDIRNTTYENPWDRPSLEPKLPQPFIWYVFESLAIAGALMVRPQPITPVRNLADALPNTGEG